jgi:hypothetical protein
MDWEDWYRQWGTRQQPGERPLGGGLQPGLPQPMQEQVAAQALQAQQQDSGLTQTGNSKLDAITEGLMAMATSFTPDPGVQILPSPYKGGPIDRIRGGGAPGLMELMAYISQQGGGLR